MQTKKNTTKTILIITLGFVIIYKTTHQELFLVIGLLVGILGAFSDFIAIKIEFLWDKLTWILSKIVPTLLLSIIFYVFLFPISIMNRLFGNKDPLLLKNKNQSYFINRSKLFNKEDLEKTW